MEKIPSTIEEDAAAALHLIPCHVCNRTFVLASLKKHEKICEKTLVKKRKPFDSLKQRVDGTDIAPFHQRTYIKKPEPVPEVKRKRRSSWKEKHLELLNSIRAAKGVPPNSEMPSNTRSSSSFLADTERCPCCDRQFGPKAYDRHVEWCKEKKAHQRLHQSPANVLLAKERLDARIKYVPPLNKSKRTPVKEKYSSQTPSSVSSRTTESTCSLVSQPSIRRKRIDSNLAKSREKEPREEKTNMTKPRKEERRMLRESKSLEEKARISEQQFELNVQAVTCPSPKAESVKRNSSPDPFSLAQLQLLELLDCPDFKSLTSTPIPQHKFVHQIHVAASVPPLPAITFPESTKQVHQNNKVSLESLTDDFELMESLIEGNDVQSVVSSVNGKLIIDDVTSIDPSLINENDNLSIPENFILAGDSPTSVVEHHFIKDSGKHQTKSKKNTSKPESTKLKNVLSKFSPSKITKKKSQIESHPVTKSLMTVSQKITCDTNDKKLKTKKKMVTKSVSSFSSEKLLNAEKRDRLSPLKKSILDPVPSLSTSIKNRKNSRSSGLEHEETVGDWFDVNNEQKSPVSSIKPEDLFAVDDAMYEEFKKYEEMYLKERKQRNSNKKSKPKLIEINYKILTEEDQLSHLNNKISSDSAYGSLTRSTPDHNQSKSLALVEPSSPDKPIMDEMDRNLLTPSPSLPKTQRLPKFCHECGNKYPLDTAKFCVECGVRRLIL